MDARDQIPPRLFALFADGVCRAGGWFIFFATSRLTRARPSRNSDQARTALRRGAPLLKYCRNAKPHVSHFQLSADEARLEWVGKNAKTKGVPMAAVADALPGRASEVFRKWASLEAEHPPEVCLGVRYEIQENQKAKTKRFRTLDLVFEDPAREPGNLGFDPLKFSDNAATKEQLQMAELRNGRLAMLAFSGMIHQTFVTGKPLFASLSDIFAAP